MKVDIQDVLFWMDAIRNSKDKLRTLESFWKGQVNSKVWLIEHLQKILNAQQSKTTVVIHGGWNGVLSSLLFNSNINIKHITSVDIDPLCEEIANTINKQREIDGKFTAVTADMCTHVYDAQVVINTSCEHITQSQYNQWLLNVPEDSYIVLQSNNFFELEEHIRCAVSVDDFVKMSNIQVLYKGELQTPKYNRYMIIGKPNV